MKKHNFSAGPAILPASVIKEAARAVANYEGIGLSLLELSHRGPEFTAIIEEANALMKEIIGLPDGYHVLWLGGGASTQFYQIPFNLLNEGETAAYADTGVWANKAIKEAKAFGNIEVVASSKEQNYTSIPKNYKIPKTAKYLHLTSNNTIYGTQLHKFPKSPVPLVCDMSSDFLSRPFNPEQFGIIYAGAQKNLGPAVGHRTTPPAFHAGLPDIYKGKLPVQHATGIPHLCFLADPALDQKKRWIKSHATQSAYKRQSIVR
jgi:phosphoserine aminotransferase